MRSSPGDNYKNAISSVYRPYWCNTFLRPYSSQNGTDSYFLSRFSEKESMAKKEGARGIPISPGPLKAAKNTASVFLDLSRVA